MSEYMKHILEIEKVKKEADELMIKKIEYYVKEIALVREQCQIDLLTKDKQLTELQNRLYSAEEVNQAHQKLNGELIEDNKKLAKQIDDYVNKLRKAGLL